MNSSSSFGRQALQTETAFALLELESRVGRSNGFKTLDALVGEFLLRSLRGERVIEMIQRREYEHSIVIPGLRDEYRAFVEDTFRLERQQARGAWFLPDEVSLRVGMLNLPANFQKYPRFASSITWEEHGQVSLGNSANALLVWAILEPLFDALFQPFVLRGRLAGSKSQEEQLKSWHAVDVVLETLGFTVSHELAVMRYGGGWHKLRSGEQLVVKQRLLAALARQAEPSMGARYRAYCLRLLLDHYYKKAKADGRVKRKQALTKPLERMIAGYFGGDWLAFLRYIDEEPHPEEQIVTALPKTRLHVGGVSRAVEVAAEMGIPAEEVERMMAAYWQQDSGASPIEQRVDLLSRYWHVFDEIHARQTEGMKALWGLVEDSRSFDFYNHLQSPYQPRLYLQHLPKSMLSEIERLWGTVMLPRWPDRIVSEPFPHMLLAETLGPALKFWHGCALTAWFVCEGPYSRTNMAGLAEYYRREISELEDLGTPVDSRLFEELVKAEANLGPPQPVNQHSSMTQGKSGISITITMSSGTRREGFKILRDIITRYRRQWTQEHLDRYLRMRWEYEIREAGHAYNQLLHDIGKAPTPKQFAKVAAQATNHWFGGDVSGLYGAIREKSPVHPLRTTILPADTYTFAFSIFKALGGEAFQQMSMSTPQQDFEARKQEWDRYLKLKELAERSVWYVQLEEGLGRLPELKEFGLKQFAQLSTVVIDDIDKAWRIYSEAIQAAKASCSFNS